MAEGNYLVVLTFQGAKTAAAMYTQLQELEKKHGVSIVDAVIIERGAGASPGTTPPVELGSGQGTASAATTTEDHVRVIQTHGKKGKYAAGGAGIGLLAGFLLGGPIGAAAVGAGLGAVTAAIKDFGIDDASVAAIQSRLQPDSSALLALGHVRDREAYIASLRTFDPYVVSTTLTPEVEEELRKRLAVSADEAG
jgi:uncharacterized membrane protein